MRLPKGTLPEINNRGRTRAGEEHFQWGLLRKSKSKASPMRFGCTQDPRSGRAGAHNATCRAVSAWQFTPTTALNSAPAAP